MSWHNIAGSLVELTRDYRIDWENVWSENYCRASVGQFVFFIKGGELTVQYRNTVHTVACSDTLRERLFRLVEEHLDTREGAVVKHLDAVLLQRISQWRNG